MFPGIHTQINAKNMPKYADNIPSSSTPIDDYIVRISCNPKSITLFSTNEVEIAKIIDNLLNKQSKRPDGISNKPLKCLKCCLTEPLCIVFNRSISEGVFHRL